MLEAHQFSNFSLIVYKMRMTNLLDYKCFSRSGLLSIEPSLLGSEEQECPPPGVEFQKARDVPQVEHFKPSICLSVKIKVTKSLRAFL